jgi:hypothetical protein
MAVQSSDFITFSGFQSEVGNRAVLLTDFTSANASGLQLITGLSVSPPTNYAGVSSFHCALGFSQGTPGAGDQFGVAVLTTAPTRVDAYSSVSTNTTATAYGALNNLTTTTPTAVITFTQVASGVSPAYIDGLVQWAGTGVQTLQFYVTNGTAANVIAVKAGSYCILS